MLKTKILILLNNIELQKRAEAARWGGGPGQPPVNPRQCIVYKIAFVAHKV